MKKLLITCCLLAVSISIFSQEKPTKVKKTVFGITSGFTSNFYEVRSDSRNSVINHDTAILFGGLFLETSLNNRWSLQTEIIYSRIGSEDYHMLEVPLFLKYRVGNRWSIYGGAQINYLFNGKEDAMFAKDIDVPLTLGFVVGIEYDITERWSIYLRYIHRFTDQIHPDLGNINGVRLGIAYRF